MRRSRTTLECLHLLSHVGTPVPFVPSWLAALRYSLPEASCGPAKAGPDLHERRQLLAGFLASFRARHLRL